ncbi:Pyrrolysyl-tRNA synthetase, C-terminal region [Desulfamplus magnetovallimortis]|uniref:Pyrrolysyl-tRNA synthetase, C-terminal region n=1 Tax=Desulfamplus magnetovallimortis TaxID=1246637 RepID=A0A1W1HGE5_9BACT|nr:pyrrolysine--tRNA(Pyl) ligase large subunit [Desulfamplus magnetovallimortis]SLM31493.1 Pyrrolysyl-tRNA synthetase, C-terminal region [Desulfamplus magnetovallimortis]
MNNPDSFNWTDTQQRRLKELGAEESVFSEKLSSASEKNRRFQEIEKRLVKQQQKKLNDFIANASTPRLHQLERKLAAILKQNGFARVSTPLIISRAALAKMSIDNDHQLFRQIYWLNERQCLRPMLAPGLYSLMIDFQRLKHRPVRFFEIGSCFRRETDGAKHNSEFTMLNLVEMGLPENERLERLQALGRLIADTAGIDDYRFETEDSVVYGDTLDIVAGKEGIEIASGAIGPHPLDTAWKITETWVGLGFGLERLVMISEKETSIGKWCKSTAYLDGIRLNI